MNYLRNLVCDVYTKFEMAGILHFEWKHWCMGGGGGMPPPEWWDLGVFGTYMKLLLKIVCSRPEI